MLIALVIVCATIVDMQQVDGQNFLSRNLQVGKLVTTVAVHLGSITTL